METLIKADIFFFIAAVATVVIGVLLAVALVYLIRILRDVREIAEMAKAEAAEIVEDVGEIRRDVKDAVSAGVSAARNTARLVRPEGLLSTISFLVNSVFEARGRKKGRARRNGGTQKGE